MLFFMGVDIKLIALFLYDAAKLLLFYETILL